MEMFWTGLDTAPSLQYSLSSPLLLSFIPSPPLTPSILPINPLFSLPSSYLLSTPLSSYLLPSFSLFSATLSSSLLSPIDSLFLSSLPSASLPLLISSLLSSSLPYFPLFFFSLQSRLPFGLPPLLPYLLLYGGRPGTGTTLKMNELLLSFHTPNREGEREEGVGMSPGNQTL